MKTVDQIMDNPLIYRAFQRMILRPKFEIILNNQIIRPKLASKILDFGCGVGHSSQLFTHASYVGIEPLSACIDRAKSMYNRANSTFIVGDENYLANLDDEDFDLVIAIGVLHHISDKSATKFISEAKRLLKPGGRFVTLDPYFFTGQRKTSRFVISQDRGKNVRTEDAYKSLISGEFHQIEITKFSKMIRIPYDHLAITAYAD